MFRKSSAAFQLGDKVCLVTGASRGIGKGIAVQLAYHGATCYVTGRNMDSLEKLNKEVEDLGGSGKCIPIQCDHRNDDAIEKLFERIDKENDGQLDLLVNNAYAAIENLFGNIGKNFWELPPEAWDVYNNVGLRNNHICSTYAARIMVKNRKGLIINLSSVGGLKYFFSVPYGVGKAATDRMARDAALELKKFQVAFVSLCPGLAKTETITKIHEKSNSPEFKILFAGAESPTFIGRTVVALFSEPNAEIMKKTGKIVLTTDIAREYGITDEYGLVPYSFFQVNVLLRVAGYHRIAYFVPDFVRIPFFILRLLEAYRSC